MKKMFYLLPFLLLFAFPVTSFASAYMTYDSGNDRYHFTYDLDGLSSATITGESVGGYTFSSTDYDPVEYFFECNGTITFQLDYSDASPYTDRTQTFTLTEISNEHSACYPDDTSTSNPPPDSTNSDIVSALETIQDQNAVVQTTMNKFSRDLDNMVIDLNSIRIYMNGQNNLLMEIRDKLDTFADNSEAIEDIRSQMKTNNQYVMDDPIQESDFDKPVTNPPNFEDVSTDVESAKPSTPQPTESFSDTNTYFSDDPSTDAPLPGMMPGAPPVEKWDGVETESPLTKDSALSVSEQMAKDNPLSVMPEMTKDSFSVMPEMTKDLFTQDDALSADPNLSVDAVRSRDGEMTRDQMTQGEQMARDGTMTKGTEMQKDQFTQSGQLVKDQEMIKDAPLQQEWEYGLPRWKSPQP